MEQVVVRHAVLAVVALLNGALQVVGAEHERRGVVGAVHRLQVAGIEEQLGVGTAESGYGLRFIRLGIGLGRQFRVAQVEVRVAHLRAEVADLLQAVLDFRCALRIELVSLGIGGDGFVDQVVADLAGLPPRRELAVANVGLEVGIDQHVELRAVERLLLHGERIAHGELQHRGLHAGEDVARGLRGRVEVSLAAADPRSCLGRLLRVGDVGIALGQFRTDGLLIDPLCLGRGCDEEQRRRSHHDEFFHNERNFRFSVCFRLFTVPRRAHCLRLRLRPSSRPHRQPPRRRSAAPPPRTWARPSPRRWRRPRAG